MKFNLFKFYLYLPIIVFFITSQSIAKEPIEFIKYVTSKASQVLLKQISKEEKILELRNLAEENVDINGVGLYSLGKYRKAISSSQLEEYKKLFKEYFLKSFSSRLSEYSDPRINVISQEILSEKYTMVSSVLVASENRPEISIQWRVYTKDPNNPLIRDLIIEGLSLAKTQKEEFYSVIKGGDGDINILFNNLKTFVTK